MDDTRITIDQGLLTILDFGRRQPDIPVTFTHKGKLYKGLFSEVPGAAGYEWSLNVNGFFRGTIRWSRIYDEPFDRYAPFKGKEKFGLIFYTQNGDLDYLADEFIEQLIAWYE